MKAEFLYDFSRLHKIFYRPFCDENDREDLARAIQNMITVYAFNVPAAIQASILFQQWKSLNLKTITGRQTVKADCQIIGTALAIGALKIYSEDSDIEKIANNRIKVLPIPVQNQLDLEL